MFVNISPYILYDIFKYCQIVAPLQPFKDGIDALNSRLSTQSDQNCFDYVD